MLVVNIVTNGGHLGRNEMVHLVNRHTVINWISQVLGDELQQLGMPKEHAGAIARFPPNS